MSTDGREAPDDKRFVVRQEPDRLDRRGVAVGALIAAFGIALSLGVTMAFTGTSDHEPVPPTRPAGPAQASTVETSLIVATERGLALRAAQRASLDRYGWVDRDAGIAQIPIERAMDIVGQGPPAEGPRP